MTMYQFCGFIIRVTGCTLINCIILTVKMINNQNCENQTLFTIESLDLNFSKKKQRKASCYHNYSTDRKNSQLTLINEPPKTDRNALIEKKKSYSESIRQRNLNLLSKRKQELNCFYRPSQNYEQSVLLQIKENLITDPTHEHIASTLSKKNQKSLPRQKKSLINMSVLEFQSIPLHHQFFENTQTKTNIFQQGHLHSPRVEHVAKQIRDITKKASIEQLKQVQDEEPVKANPIKQLTMCSKIYSQQILVLDSDTNVLMRQNATFKRDLASFRKENSVLRKQLSDAKNHIQEFEERARSILEGSLVKSVKLSLDESQQPPEQEICNSAEIIEKLRQEVLELKKLNSTLELRTYMAEKKVAEQIDFYKKKSAKQLQEWRQKCTKLRAENLRFKSFRDMTLSMEISKDEQ